MNCASRLGQLRYISSTTSVLDSQLESRITKQPCHFMQSGRGSMNNVRSHLLIKCCLTPLGMLVGSLASPGFRNLSADEHFLTGCFPLGENRACVSCKKKGKKGLSRIVWEIMINGRVPSIISDMTCVPRALFSMHRLYFLSHPFLTTPFFMDSRSKAAVGLVSITTHHIKLRSGGLDPPNSCI